MSGDSWVCAGCKGKITPNKKITVEATFATHEATCPGRLRVR